MLAGTDGVLDYGSAVLLGVVQGISEFLPISSTAHLKIVPVLLGMGDPGAAASAVIQLGTTAALVLYFSGDLRAMALAALRPGSQAHVRRLPVILIIGTLPIVILGLLLKSAITGPLRSMWVIAGAAAFFAILLAGAERFAARARRPASEISIRDAWVVGFAQSLALIPGASRSGTTMTGAFFAGIERSAAARFSFLLSIPATAAAGFKELYDERAALLAAGFGPLAVATAVSGIVGYVCLDLLLRFLRTRSVMPFVVYRLALSGLLFALLATGRLQP